MLSWLPNFDNIRNPTVLCLGAHCDDIEIGCGGALIHLSKSHSGASFHNVIFSSTPERETESRKALSQLLASAKNNQIDVLNFRNSYFPYCGAEIKDYFNSLKANCQPDLIFTHFRNDRHQDHRLISDLTWNTYRDHSILEYEIPKYDGDVGQPNVFLPISEETTNEKIGCLMTSFASQVSRDWFTEETFRSLLRLRGIECNSASGYAEGFYARKISVAL